MSPPSPKATTPFAVSVPARVSPPPEVKSVPAFPMFKSKLFAKSVLSERVINEDPESMTMFPVDAPPKVRVFILND